MSNALDTSQSINKNHLSAFLQTSENIVATLFIDLDFELNFASHYLVLTNRRIFLINNDSTQPNIDNAFSLIHISNTNQLDLSLSYSDHSGVGLLELKTSKQRLMCWRLTLNRRQNVQISRFIKTFEQQQMAIQAAVQDHQKNNQDHFSEVNQADIFSKAEQFNQQNQSAHLSAICSICEAELPNDSESDECALCSSHEEKPPSTWVLLRLWRFAHPYRWQLAAGFSLMLLSTAATLIPPYLTIPIMDEILIPFQNGKPIDPKIVAMYLSGLLGSALIAWILSWWRTYLLALVSERIGSDLRTKTYEHLLRLSLDYFGNKRTGDLMARIGSETDRINLFLSLHALDFATDVVMIVMTSAILFSINPWLALVTLVPLPFIAWLIHKVRDKLRTGFEKIDRVWSQVTNVLADTIPGIRVVKAFAQEEREAERFRIANRHNLEVNDRLNKTWSLFSPTVSLLTEMGLLVVWAFGIYLIAKSQITVGILTAFLAYIGRFYARLDSMSRIVSVTQKAAAGAKRIFDILDHVSNVPEPSQPIQLKEPIQGRLEMRDVGFRYGTRSVIRQLNLDIRAGEMIGLVGHSGSGKSTLVNLLCRFYDVSEGSIRLDGVDIRRLTVANYRQNIGLVLQEPFLFFGTIAENIAYGKPNATRAEIIAAARAAHAHQFILRLPLGYDSLVGERGQGLSGGERQRISIARALLINPRILILDEATSAVDTETEKEIQRALDNLVQGRTTIAIAHRLSTLRKADRLVVMDKGEIVEVGHHDELITKQGAYWRLYEAQARRADGNDQELIAD